MTVAAHGIAALAYALALVLDFRGRRAATNESGFGPPARGPVRALAAGALVHALAFVSVHADSPPVPLESVGSALSLMGFLLALSYLLALRVARVRELGGAVAGTAAALTLFAAGVLHARGAVVEPAGSAWSHAHVLLSTFGFSLLALSSLAGIGYLAKQHALKRKRAGLALPSLESLDRVEHWALGLGFALLTLGVISGFAWSVRQGYEAFTSHSLFLIAAWAIYLAPIQLRLVRRQHGDRPARFVVAGFLFLAVSYFGVRLLGGSA